MISCISVVKLTNDWLPHSFFSTSKFSADSLSLICKMYGAVIAIEATGVAKRRYEIDRLLDRCTWKVTVDPIAIQAINEMVVQITSQPIEDCA